MQVVAKSIDEINPYENNPRDNDDAVDAVAGMFTKKLATTTAKSLMLTVS